MFAYDAKIMSNNQDWLPTKRFRQAPRLGKYMADDIQPIQKQSEDGILCNEA